MPERYVARQIFHTITADLAELHPAAHGRLVCQRDDVWTIARHAN